MVGVEVVGVEVGPATGWTAAGAAVEDGPGAGTPTEPLVPGGVVVERRGGGGGLGRPPGQAEAEQRQEHRHQGDADDLVDSTDVAHLHQFALLRPARAGTPPCAGPVRGARWVPRAGPRRSAPVPRSPRSGGCSGEDGPARRLGPVKGVGEQARGIPISDSTGGATDDHRAASPATRPPGAAGVGDPGSAGEGTDGAVDRILTVPNAITLVRLACIPLFLWLLFGAGRPDGGGHPARRPRGHRLDRRVRGPALPPGVDRRARSSTPWPTGCWWSRR